jgi:hypothetical protein
VTTPFVQSVRARREPIRIGAGGNGRLLNLRVEIPERGWEVLDEGQSIADVGALDGSIFLLTNRRRRPVR